MAFQATGPTIAVAATTSNTSTAIVLGGASHIRVVNTGTTAVFVRAGVGAQTATAADLPVAGSYNIILAADPKTTHTGAIMASSTATVYFTPGYES